MDNCQIRKELSQKAEEILKTIIATNEAQVVALRSGDQIKLMQKDKELENLVGGGPLGLCGST